MTQVSTPTGAQPAAPHRHSAALIVAATLCFVAAALTVGALFPDYWDTPELALWDQTGLLAPTLVFAAGLLFAGGLLLVTGSAPVGAAMLLVMVLVAVQPRVDDAMRLTESSGPKAGTGFALVTAGYVLALVSMVLAALVALRPRAWALLGGARFLATLAVLTGFGAAVGYGMNPFKVDTVEGATGFGTPLDPLPRQLWAALLVVVVLTVVPAIAVAVGGRLGTGLAFGLLFAVGGIVAFRIGTVYGTVDGRDTGFGAAEGTWTFIAAGGAALIMTFAGLAAGAPKGRRTRRAREFQPVSATVPPPPEADVPTEPIVAGDDPAAIIEAPGDDAGPVSDAPSDEATEQDIDTSDADEPTRANPMPAASSTWSASNPPPAGDEPRTE